VAEAALGFDIIVALALSGACTAVLFVTALQAVAQDQAVTAAMLKVHLAAVLGLPCCPAGGNE
jgi:hypothetical protein